MYCIALPKLTTTSLACFLGVCLSLSVLSSTAEAQETEAATALRDQVANLVRDLNARELSRRESAEESLIELGPSALKFFPEITPRTPAEVKERLGRARTVLEKATAASVVKPSKVTLEGKMTLSEALSAFEQQTGNRVTGYQNRSGSVEVHFQDTPYWEALDQVLDQVGLGIDAYAVEPSVLKVAARGDSEKNRYGRATYSGAFRFEPLRIEARRNLRNPAVDSLQLTVNISWEPKVRPISLQQQLQQITALDDRGEAIAVGEGGVRSGETEMGIAALELVIPFTLPPREAKSIESLSGKLTAVVPGGEEQFEFTDLADARDTEQSKAGVTVVFERARKNQAFYEMRFRVRFENAGAALESHHSWIYENETYVVDAAGTRIDHSTYHSTFSRNGEVGLAYLFLLSDGLEGCKFVYRTPASILQLPVEYHLKQVPLP